MKVCAGWFIIGIVATQLAANTLIMLVLTIKEGWVKVKRRYQRWKQRRQDNAARSVVTEATQMKSEQNEQEN